MRLFFTNWKLLFTMGFLLVVLVLLLAFSIGRQGQVSEAPIPSNNPFVNVPVDEVNFIQSPQVLNIDPVKESILTPGQNQIFSIEFSEPIALSSIFVSLKTREIVGEVADYKDIEFKQELSDDRKTLLIETKEPIATFQNYNLTIFERSGNKLVQATYTSDRDERPRESQNNPDLAQYLPHTTPSYTLSYVPERNLYVFSFSYDETSSESLDSQYEKAQADAIRFIESRGIPISSIVIEWRYK